MVRSEETTTLEGGVSEWRDPFYADTLRRFALRFRRQRFALLLDRLRLLGERRVRILDLGGYESFWVEMGGGILDRHEVVILNLDSETRDAVHPHVRTLAGDACDLGRFNRGDFDVVFSNSVIEHVGLWDRQRAMAREIQRLSDCYFIQTPNYWFPLEPHFHVPGFQWLPLSARTRLIQRYKLGLMPRFPDAEDARRCAESTRLLTRAELEQLFPGAQIQDERLFGMVKSYIAIHWGS